MQKARIVWLAAFAIGASMLRTVALAGPEELVDLFIEKADSADPANVGDSIIYTITVGNFTGATATEVVVVDTLPPGLVLESLEAGCDEVGNGKVRCVLPDLPPGDTVDVQIGVRAPETGEYENVALVESAESDVNPANNEVAETTTVVDATTLEAEPLLVRIRGPNSPSVLLLEGVPTATLSYRDTGEPIEGATIVFRSLTACGDFRPCEICSSQTDASGRASCPDAGFLPSVLQLNFGLGLRYSAEFAGDVERRWGSSYDEGGVVHVFDVKP